MNRKKKNEVDIVEIGIDICDIYYGNTKRVEFELLDICDKCNGCGAQDPSYVVNCLNCNGQGSVTQQLAPFFVQKVTCPSCMGKGQVIKNNKVCTHCKGEKVAFTKRVFELKLPRGIPNNHEIKMEKKGSYSQQLKAHRDILFKFKYNILPPYSVDENFNVTYKIPITIEELLAGFKKNIDIYKDTVTISSTRYFNPDKQVVIKEKGLFNIKKQKSGDLYLKFDVIFTDSERLCKYNEVLQKVLKKQRDPLEDAQTVYTVQDLL
jgi:DnaJ-class molecular chaperone